ncbi:MAG: hypothetical protein Q7U76_13055 [Nitrospirota bacterium]|nr:hypothetical protein [Nitrospirota bacterium]
MALPVTKTGILPNDIRSDYLFGLIQSIRPNSDFSEVYLLNKLRQAEDAIERDLGILLQTQVIVSEGVPGLAEGVVGANCDIAEPAYDYSSDFYDGERWGSIRLRRYPVQSVQSVVFAYPNINSVVFTVPSSWIRLDGPFGLIRLVPDRVAIYASFTSYLLSLFAGGRGVPQSLFVNYTAGFGGGTKMIVNDTDLLEHVKRTVVVEIARDAMLPNSLSNSADGISQSISASLKDYRDEIKEDRKVFREKIKGVRMVVC